MVTKAIAKADSGRADHLLRQVAPELPRALMKQLFQQGRIRANGRRVQASSMLSGPVTFEWDLPKPSAGTPNEHIRVLEEAPDWFAVSKPSGVHSVRLTGRGGPSLEDWLAIHEPSQERLAEHGLVNRLDLETSGIVLVGRTEKIQQMLRDRLSGAEKTYWAGVIGNPPDEGIVDFELRASSRNAPTVSKFGRRAQRTGITRFHTTSRKDGFALLEVKLVGPGARHQIRAHLSGEGLPVAGDRLYGGDRLGAPDRLALHAWKVKLDGSQEITDPVPPELLDWWESL
ncbi:MAG: RNA pseudouridine synthase [Deltaproteobacteria bacterium]|nr:RNA pseudouridine synthase [Deltaproteobacteria bacterium]